MESLCIVISAIMSIVAVSIAASRKFDTDDSAIAVFAVSFIVATILLIVGIETYSEPQKLKEQAVEIGVGTFVANKKGVVEFYFIKPDGTLVKSYKYGEKEQ